MSYFRNIAVSLATLFAFVVAAQAETISPQEASQHIGSYMTVEGIVRQVSSSRGGTTFINFGGRYPNHIFYGVIFKNSANKFSGIQALEGATVALTGTIKLYKGKQQIILSSPDQIELR